METPMSQTPTGLATELLSISAMNSFAKHNDANRGQMFTSHISQHLVIKDLQEKIIQSGMEHEFAKHTFSIKMPADGRIIKLIQRYPQGIDKDSLPFNPETLVIYEKEETKEIDCFSIPYHASFHQFFGYEYQLKEASKQIKPGAYIAKDTVFSDTPGVSDNGIYMYGTNLNTAFMSIPSVSEDGVMISEAAIDRLSFKIYESRTVSFGSTMFPLNIYGTLKEYRPFPEIGSYLKNVRNDGILMMLRNYQNEFSPVDLSVFDVQEPDFMFDKGVFVRGPHGRVVDIEVIKNHDPRTQLPEEMCGYIDKYHRALMRYYQDILQTERELRLEAKRKYGENFLKLSPKFHNLVVKAMALTNHPIPKESKVLNLQYRRAPLDEYMINFTIEYDVRPNLGFKLTDESGGQNRPHLYSNV